MVEGHRKTYLYILREREVRCEGLPSIYHLEGKGVVYQLFLQMAVCFDFVVSLPKEGLPREILV